LKKLLFLAVALLTVTPSALAHDWVGARADGHAPIGVMGDHTHSAGYWMLSYRYMTMRMDGNIDGTSDLSNAEVRAKGFAVVPTEMTMEMHMFGAMRGVSENLTMMVMLPYISKSMDHQRPNGTEFTKDTEGFGDLEIGGMIDVWEGEKHRAHVTLGVSLPTGSIDEDQGQATRLPYPMQLGSGSYEFLPSVTINGQNETCSWGAQLGAVLRLNENDNDYQLGNQINSSVWGAHKWCDGFSSSVRLNAKAWDDIHRSDPDLSGVPVPTADEDRRSGERIDFLIGANLYWPKVRGFTGKEDQRLAIEFGVPIHQRLDGPQLETDWTLMIGWQSAF
jgi:hypothetical protein